MLAMIHEQLNEFKMKILPLYMGIRKIEVIGETFVRIWDHTLSYL